MPEFASMTAMCKCTMGTSPTTLVVLPTNMTFTNVTPNSIKVNINHKQKLDDFVFDIEPFRRFLNVLENIPGYSIDIFIKRIPRLLNEPYTKDMSFTIAKKVTERSVVRLVKIAAGAKV